MADLKGLKGRSRLPEPPPIEKAGANLSAPEVAPVGDIDGRSLHKTGRTKQLATRVTEEFHDSLRIIAARDRVRLVELLEIAVQAYESLSQKDRQKLADTKRSERTKGVDD